MGRYLETLIRFRLRFVILLLIAPLSLGASTALVLRSYEATAALWVSDPTYLGQDAVPVDWNRHATPAQNTVDTLRQLLGTYAFDRQVADRLLATGVVADQASASRAGESLSSEVHLQVDGAHLARLTYFSADQKFSLGILRSVVVLYLEHELTAQKAQLDVSTTFLSTAVTDAESRSNVAQQAVGAYLAAHPSVRAPSGSGDTGVADLDRLLQQARQSDANLAALRAQLAQARFVGAAGQRLVETDTTVVDQPRVIGFGLIGDGRSLASAISVALLTILLAGLYLALLVWADQTARDSKELERRLNVPVLTTIPLISLQERF